MKRLTWLLRVVGTLQILLGLLYLIAPGPFLTTMGHTVPDPDVFYPLAMLAARFLAYGAALIYVSGAPARHRLWIDVMVLIQVIDLAAGIFYTVAGVVPLALSGFPMFNAAWIIALLVWWRPGRGVAHEAMTARRVLGVLVALGLAGVLTVPSQAAAQHRATVAVETDPATFVLGGYGAHIKVRAPQLAHWVFGVGGAGSLQLPDALVGMNAENRGEGWDVRVRHGLGVFVDYYFDPATRGWLVGAQLSEQAFDVGRDDHGGRTRFSAVVLMVHGGYRWFPWRDGLYVRPWVGLGYATRVSGDATLGAEEYAVAPLVPFATVHVGYRF